MLPVSSIGKKIVMAVTGCCLVLFLLVHLLGNLSIYGGPGSLNAYAEFLHSKPTLLWIARLGLIGLFVLHVIFGLWLYIGNWVARPHRYVRETTLQATLSSRTMIWTGALILIFLAYHLAHLTLRWLYFPGERFDAMGRFDEFFMVTSGFKNTSVMGAYVVVMLIFWMHLRHGASSLFQTLGFSHFKYEKILTCLGIIIATLIVGGCVSIPFLIWSGVIGGNAL